LIDPLQDSWRVGNWGVVSTNAPVGSQWQYVTLTGIATRSTLLIGMSMAGDVYIDDLKLVAAAFEVGANCSTNGGFESPFSRLMERFGEYDRSASAPLSSIRAIPAYTWWPPAAGRPSTRRSGKNTTTLVTNGIYTLSFWHFAEHECLSLLIRLWEAP
jgi:hypothetical protein